MKPTAPIPAPGRKAILARHLSNGAILAAGTMLLVTACQRAESPRPQAALPPEAIATVNGTVISETEFRQLLGQRPQRRPDALSVDAHKEALLDELIAFESVYAKAVAAGFDQDPAVSRLLKRLVVTKYREAQLGASPAEVTEEEAHRHYLAHAASFGVPEQRRAAVIRLDVPSTASAARKAEIRQRAESARAAAMDSLAGDRAFAVAAQKYSEDQATRYQGGATGWLLRDPAKQRWEPPVIEAAFTLPQPGAISPVLDTPGALYLVQLLEVRPAAVRPWEEVREAVRYRLQQDRQARQEQEFVAAMKSGLDIRIDRQRLAGIEPPQRSKSPPATPGPRLSQLEKRPGAAAAAVIP